MNDLYFFVTIVKDLIKVNGLVLAKSFVSARKLGHDIDRECQEGDTDKNYS